MSLFGCLKFDVLFEMFCDINFEVELNMFSEGVMVENVDFFLNGVDVYVDGFDFFVFDVWWYMFLVCEVCGIFVVMVVLFGLGSVLLVFGFGGMLFEDYFGFEGCDDFEMVICFLVGLLLGML